MKIMLKILVLITIPIWIIPASLLGFLAVLYFEVVDPLVDKILDEIKR